MQELRLFRRPDGRLASRQRLLVIPSVVCANAVARAVAAGVSTAAYVNHQHGCAQVGDDAEFTSHALTRLGGHPNAWGTLVVSLGCETGQGAELVERLRRQNLNVELVGIQAAGGSSKAIEAGRAALAAMSPLAGERVSVDASIRVGVAFQGSTGSQAVRCADALRAAGFETGAVRDVSSAPVLGVVEFALSEELLTLVFVADRGVPVAPVLTPLISVSTNREHFERSEGDFDLGPMDENQLPEVVTRVLEGAMTVTEDVDHTHFAIRRSAVSL